MVVYCLALLQDESDPVSTSADAAAVSPREGRRSAAQLAQVTSTHEARPVQSRLARQTCFEGNALGYQGW